MKFIAPSLAASALLILVFAAPATVAAKGFSPYWGPILSCTATNPAVSGESKLPPCTSICDLLATAQNLLYFVITIAIFIIAPLMFIWGGVTFITSFGSPERIESGRKILTATVIGLALVICSFLIVNTIFYLIAKFPGSATGDIKWSEISCTATAP